MDNEFRLDTSVTESGTLIVRVTGELDMATSELLSKTIVDWPEPVSACIVDLSACSFVDSSGIRALLMCQRQLGDQATLELIGVIPYIDRILRIAGVQEVMQITSIDE